MTNAGVIEVDRSRTFIELEVDLATGRLSEGRLFLY
jgi:hypothetical protein